MRKQTTKKNIVPIDSNTADQYMTEHPASEVLKENYMPYAMSVIVSRAIPEIDGFKPAHRKLLYTMYQMKLQGKKIKCANIVGQTMQLNPHGDSSIYETMVRLSRGNETLLMPFVDSKGNMGKHYSRDMQFAAYRYTEAGLAPISEELFHGIHKDAVDMIDNYDGTKKEPVLLPVSFPNILVTPTMGIAVGMTSQICSFNFHEVCSAAIAFIKNPKTDLLKIMPAPDFSTGGEIIYDEEEMRKIYETGEGKVTIRSKYRVDPKKRTIEITEIPYTTTIEAIVDKISELCKKGTIKEISRIRDDTDKNGMLITIDYKSSVNPDALMQKLFQKTPLQDAFCCKFNVLIGNNPRVLGIYDLLREWTSFRMECIRRELSYDLQNKQKTLHLLEGLEKILLHIDKAYRILKNTEKDEDVVPNLMTAFKIDEIQAEYVADIKMRNLNKDYILQKTKEIEVLRTDIDKLEHMIQSDSELKKYIISQLQTLMKNKKYLQPRRSAVITDTLPVFQEIEEEEDKTPVSVILTEHGYIKKLKNIREDLDIKTKTEDTILRVLETDNSADILVFTDQGNVYKAKLADVPFCKPSEYGEYFNNLVHIADNENMVTIVVTSNWNEELCIVFKNGKAARFPVSVYQTKTNRKKLVNAFYTDEPSVFIGTAENAETSYLHICSNSKKKLIIPFSVIQLKNTKTTQGVQVMRMPKNGYVESASLSDVSDAKFFTDKIPSAGKK